jgi:transposase
VGSSGEVESVQFFENMTSDLFIGFLDFIAEKYEKPVVIILDNASVHTANKIKPYLELLKKKNLTLYFLPTYSRELNRIKTFWHQVKHVWMDVKHRTKQTLSSEMSHIFENFGGKFKFNFSA